MTVASVSGVALPTSAARSTVPPWNISSATPSLDRLTIVLSWGSSSRTLVKRSSKPSSSTMASFALQWPVRYATCSGDEEL